MSSLVEVNGVPTWADVHGDGEPLVLMHPGGADSRAWDSNLPALTEHFRVHRYDRRGQGRTPDIGGPISFADMALDAAAFIETVVGEPAHVAGHSIGAPVGLLLARERPSSSAASSSPRASSITTAGSKAFWIRCQPKSRPSSATSTARCRRMVASAGPASGRDSTQSTTAPRRSRPLSSARSRRRRS